MDFFDKKYGKTIFNNGGVVIYHHINWNSQSEAATIPTDGNINYSFLNTNCTHAHAHEYPEIILVLRGGLKHIINNEEQYIGSSSLVFIRPADRHFFQRFNTATTELIVFAFSLDVFMSFSRYLENDHFLWHFTESPVPPIFKIPEKNTATLSSELLKINNSSLPQINKMRVKAIVARLFSTYFLDMSTLEQKANIPEWFLTICKKMESKERLKTGLPAMQKIAGCTKEHLCKVFRRYLDRTPTSFINELRMKHAETMLAGNMEIYEISMELGIRSLSRFYHLFKKHYGITPAKFRKNLQSGITII